MTTVQLYVGPRENGERFNVVLLTRVDDSRTIHLEHPIINDATGVTGRRVAWARSHRYDGRRSTSGQANLRFEQALTARYLSVPALSILARSADPIGTQFRPLG
jgi:hypothetical protein